MDIKAQVVSAAERLFDHNGFTATGMDRLVQEAGVSSRTLYKHVGGKTSLIAAVLAERNRRFLAGLDVSSLQTLFVSLEGWVRDEGARGCLFLRAQAETGGTAPDIEAAVGAYRDQLYALVAETVHHELGESNAALAEQVLVLVEGATAAAIYRGPAAVVAARAAAQTLVTAARP